MLIVNNSVNCCQHYQQLDKNILLQLSTVDATVDGNLLIYRVCQQINSFNSILPP